MPLTPYSSKRVERKTLSLWPLLSGTLTLTITFSVSAAVVALKNVDAENVHFPYPSDLLLDENIPLVPDRPKNVFFKSGAEIDKTFYGLEGKVYYVSELGDDNNNGRRENFPFKTLQHASDLAEPGDIVYVMGGLYQNRKDEDYIYWKSNVLEQKQTGLCMRHSPAHTPKLKVKAGDAISIHGAEYSVFQSLNDPQFGQYDFRLKPDSPAIDNGYDQFASMLNSDGIALYMQIKI